MERGVHGPTQHICNLSLACGQSAQRTDLETAHDCATTLMERQELKCRCSLNQCGNEIRTRVLTNHDLLLSAASTLIDRRTRYALHRRSLRFGIYVSRSAHDCSQRVLDTAVRRIHRGHSDIHASSIWCACT